MKRRLLVALVVLVVLTGAVFGGIVLDRTVLDDDEPAGISDVEHDRLVDACTAATRAMEADDPAGCASWIARMIEHGEGEGWDYVRLAAEVELSLDEDACNQYSSYIADNCLSEVRRDYEDATGWEAPED